MVVLIILFMIAILVLLMRLLSVKKQVRHVTQQLKQYTGRRTNKKVDVALVDQDIEQLGVEINRLIDLHVKENREKIRFQQEVHQTIENISHDLRTPLTSILGYMQMMEAEITDDDQKEYLEIAKKRAKRLEHLLNDFYELSLIESNDHRLQLESINVRNVTIDVLMSFYDRFELENRQPILQIPEEDLYIRADRSAVTRVIENLLANCLKHATGDITIQLENKKERIRLVIANEAENLTEKDAEHLFDRFYMADKSRSSQNTGLGLSIVKSLMEKMNGTIESKLKNGTLSMICEWSREEKDRRQEL